jgi:hypothetical protein
MTDHLCRALDVLEAEGVRFSDSGVYLQRPARSGLAAMTSSARLRLSKASVRPVSQAHEGAHPVPRPKG